MESSLRQFKRCIAGVMKYFVVVVCLHLAQVSWATTTESYVYIINSSEAGLALDPIDGFKPVTQTFRLVLVANRVNRLGWQFPFLLLQVFSASAKESLSAKAIRPNWQGPFFGERSIIADFAVSQGPNRDGAYRFVPVGTFAQAEGNGTVTEELQIVPPSVDAEGNVTGRPQAKLLLSSYARDVKPRWIEGRGFYFSSEPLAKPIEFGQDEATLVERLGPAIAKDASLSTGSGIYSAEDIARSIFQLSGGYAPCERWTISALSESDSLNFGSARYRPPMRPSHRDVRK